jgi:hypothetical protein
MKRIAIAAIACGLLACLASDLQAHGRGKGGWGFSLHVAPPPPPPCYHPYYPPPCAYPAPYVRHYHVAPRPYYPPPRFGFWYGF